MKHIDQPQNDARRQLIVRTGIRAGAKENCAKVERHWQSQYQYWLNEAKRRGCA